MSTNTMEVIETDDTLNVSEVRAETVKTVDDYLRQINAKAQELVSEFERNQDALMAQMVQTVAAELRVRARAVCDQGGWKDRQILEKAIDKIAHSAKQQKKIYRQSKQEELKVS